MITSNISYTKNHLSELLQKVKAGESVLIVDRKRPVARLEPAGDSSSEGQPAWVADLVRAGLLRPASRKLDVRAILRRPLPKPKGDADVVQALMADREDRL